jgi:hypothetical protein
VSSRALPGLTAGGGCRYMVILATNILFDFWEYGT